MSDTDYPPPPCDPSLAYFDPNWTPALNAALAHAQGEMRAASKDAKNPHFGSRYADMASVIDACRPLSAHGLAFVQYASTAGPVVTVTTILRHASGQVLDCGTITARAKDEGPQSIGSVLTYLRRYSLQCAVGIGSADDDGQAGQGAPGSRPVAPVVPPAPVSDEPDPSFAKDRKRYFAQLASLGVSKEEADSVAEDMGAPRPSRLPQDRRDRFLAYLDSPSGRAALDVIRAPADSEPTPNEVK